MNRFDFPQMCFNAAKSWQLGWYAEKSAEIKPDKNKMTLNLDAFVDYNSVPSNEYVLLKVGTMYVIYNKQKGINSETQEFGNQVTITEMATEHDFSHAVGNLISGQKYSFTYQGATAAIEMCSTENYGGVDKATVSVYMESDGSGCPTPAPIPATQAPTTAPTLPPTPEPTMPPTPYPTLPPTHRPTEAPTLPPSQYTNFPSTSPSLTPSANPSGK